MQSLARWSMKHRRSVIAGWIAILVASLGAASALGNRFDNNLTLPHTESQRASALLAARFPSLAGDSDQIVFHATVGTLSEPATRARITAALRSVRKGQAGQSG